MRKQLDDPKLTVDHNTTVASKIFVLSFERNVTAPMKCYGSYEMLRLLWKPPSGTSL